MLMSYILNIDWIGVSYMKRLLFCIIKDRSRFGQQLTFIHLSTCWYFSRFRHRFDQLSHIFKGTIRISLLILHIAQ